VCRQFDGLAQRDGIRFFYKHYARGEGGILGDDMGASSCGGLVFGLRKRRIGLGKTIQVIGFLAAIMGAQGSLAA
jgi:hypothetical protein